MKIRLIFNEEECDQSGLKQCIPINLNMSQYTTKPFLEMAIRHFWNDYLGFDLYNAIADYYEDKESIEDEEERKKWEDLLCCARCVIAWYAYYLMLDSLVVSVSDSGVTQTHNDKVLPAETKAYNTAYWGAFNNAYDEMEILIYQCLCPNKTIFESTGFNFKEWCCNCFLWSPALFAKHQSIEKRGRLYTFITLKPYIKRAKKLYLKKMLCGLFQELLDKVCNEDELDEDCIDILECVRDILSDLTIKIAQPFLNLRLSTTGWKVFNKKSAPSERGRPNYREVEHINKTINELSPAYFKQLMIFLQENADSFPTWRDSKCNPANDPNNVCEVEIPKCNCECNPCKCSGNSSVFNNTTQIQERNITVSSGGGIGI